MRATHAINNIYKLINLKKLIRKSRHGGQLLVYTVRLCWIIIISYRRLSQHVSSALWLIYFFIAVSSVRPSSSQLF